LTTPISALNPLEDDEPSIIGEKELVDDFGMGSVK
jgi:hypothetical protein